MRELRCNRGKLHAKALRNPVDVFAIKIWIFKVEKSKCWIQASLTCVRRRKKIVFFMHKSNKLPMLKFFSLLCPCTKAPQRGIEINHWGCCRRWQQILFIPPAPPFRRDVPSTDMNNEWVFGTRMCLPKCASSCSVHSLFYFISLFFFGWGQKVSRSAIIWRQTLTLTSLETDARWA